MKVKYWKLVDPFSEEEIEFGTSESVITEDVENAIFEYNNLEDRDEYESMEDFLETRLDGFDYVVWNEVYY